MFNLSRAEIARGVAMTLWQHREKLGSAMRKVWSLLPSFGSGPAAPPRGGRGRRRRLRTRTLLGSAESFSAGTGYAPVAVNLTRQNPTWAELAPAPQLEGEEVGGVRLTGRQYLCDLTTDASTPALFGNVPTGGAVNGIGMSPDILGGRLALLARNFTKYAFRHLRLVYEPRVATSDVGSFALAIVEDPAFTIYLTPTYANIQGFVPSVKGPFRAELDLEYNYFGTELFFTEVDTSGSPEIRQTIQCSLVGFPDLSSIGAVKHGDLMLEYVVDLYGLSADYGFTVSLRSEEERKLVLEYLRGVRSQRYEDSGSWKGSVTTGRQSLSGSVVRRTAALYAVADDRSRQQTELRSLSPDRLPPSV